MSHYGRVVEVLCAWSKGSYRSTQALEEMGKMGTGARIVHTAVNQMHTKSQYYGHKSHLENI